MIIEDVWVTSLEGSHYAWPYMPQPFFDYFPIDGPKPEHFTLTPSEYDVGDDMIVCPCGEEISRESTLGQMIKQARAHIREKHRRTP